MIPQPYGNDLAVLVNGEQIQPRYIISVDAQSLLTPWVGGMNVTPLTGKSILRTFPLTSDPHSNHPQLSLFLRLHPTPNGPASMNASAVYRFGWNGHSASVIWRWESTKRAAADGLIVFVLYFQLSVYLHRCKESD